MVSVHINDAQNAFTSRSAKERLRNTIKDLVKENKQISLVSSRFVKENYKLVINQDDMENIHVTVVELDPAETIETVETPVNTSNDPVEATSNEPVAMTKEERHKILKQRIRNLKNNRSNKSGRDVKLWKKKWGDEIVDLYIKAAQTTPNQNMMILLDPDQALSKVDEAKTQMNNYLQMKKVLGAYLLKQLPHYCNYNDTLCVRLGLDPNVQPDSEPEHSNETCHDESCQHDHSTDQPTESTDQPTESTDQPTEQSNETTEQPTESTDQPTELTD